MSNLLQRLKFEYRYRFSTPPWDTGITPPELYNFIATHPSGRALDIGCGTGTNVITLLKAGWQAEGFDLSPHAITLAKRKLQKAHLHTSLYTDDATQMKHVTPPYTLALDLGCFHSIENKADYLTQLTRILTPGGFWLMYGFFKPEAALSGPGLVDADLSLIKHHNLTLRSRTDGFERQERPSAWFLWQASHD